MRCVLRRAALAAALLVAGTAAPASGLAPPAGPVILTVTGAISVTNAPGRADFDRASLEALGTTTLRTSTAWTEGVRVFEGVLARDLVRAVGARGRMAVARALNDYVAEIPLADFERYDVLLALKMNGRYMRVRDKGPIWIIYPRDEHPELRTEAVKDRSVWQLRSLEVR